MITRTLTRSGVVAGAAAALLLAGPASAFAHHCFVPMQNLNGPSSSNWFVFSAEDGAAEEAGFVTVCDAQREAGYAALREAGLPVGIKISAKQTIGENSNNPNRANGKGLEDFVQGSTLPMQMVGTYVGAASSVGC